MFISQFNTSLKADALRAVTRDGMYLKRLHPRFAKMKDIALAAVTCTPRVYMHVDKSLASDEHIIGEAIKYAANIKRIPKEAITTQIATRVVELHPRYLRELRRFRKDKHVVRTAVLKDPSAISYSRIDTEDFVYSLVESNGEVLEHALSKYHVPKFIFVAIKTYPLIVTTLHVRRVSLEMVRMAMEVNTAIYLFLRPCHRTMEMGIMYINKDPTRIVSLCKSGVEKNLVIHAIKLQPSLFPQLDVQYNTDICIAAIKADPKNISYITDVINLAFLLRFYATPDHLAYIPPQPTLDAEFYIAYTAIHGAPFCIKHIPYPSHRCSRVGEEYDKLVNLALSEDYGTYTVLPVEAKTLERAKKVAHVVPEAKHEYLTLYLCFQRVLGGSFPHIIENITHTPPYLKHGISAPDCHDFHKLFTS